jgi:hypothetical protein
LAVFTSLRRRSGVDRGTDGLPTSSNDCRGHADLVDVGGTLFLPKLASSPSPPVN